MATKTSTAAQATSPTKMIHEGVWAVAATYTQDGTTASAGDVIQMVKVPKGAYVLGVKVAGGPVASAGCSVTVGDGNSAARFASTTSASSDMALTECAVVTGHQYQYTADDTIDITISAIASATATGTFKLVAYLSMDP